MKKISYRPDTWNAETGVVQQDRSTRQPAKEEPSQPAEGPKPEIKQMRDGTWMISKPTGKDREWLRQIWDKSKKKKLKEWTVTAKDKTKITKASTPVQDWVARQMSGDIVNNKAIEEGYGASESFPNPPTPEELTRETVLKALEERKNSNASYRDIIKKVTADVYPFGMNEGTSEIPNMTFYNRNEGTELTLKEILMNNPQISEEAKGQMMEASVGEDVTMDSGSTSGEWTYRRVG